MKNKKIINCDKSTIVNRLNLINSNKLNSDESLIYFAGILYSIILNRAIFYKNMDLKLFINEFILIPTNKEQFRPYVYKSRTLLGSRVYRTIVEDFDYSLVREISKKLFIYFESPVNNNANKDNLKSNNIASELSGWLKND